MTHKNFSTFT